MLSLSLIIFLFCNLLTNIDLFSPANNVIPVPRVSSNPDTVLLQISIIGLTSPCIKKGLMLDHVYRLLPPVCKSQIRTVQPLEGAIRQNVTQTNPNTIVVFKHSIHLKHCKTMYVVIIQCHQCTLSCSSSFVIDAKTEFSAPQLSAASSQFFSSVEIFQHFLPAYKSEILAHLVASLNNFYLRPAFLTCCVVNHPAIGTMLRICILIGILHILLSSSSITRYFYFS